MNRLPMGTRQKALELNLDGTTYGTFAEIGAGQEVARWFFSVGGAAGTVAKSISAYDMTVSDALYGTAQRYVSRERLKAMLEQEFDELRARLDAKWGDAKCFFVFADTVATSGHEQRGNGRAWLGIRFQAHPHEDPSEMILHSHLLDPSPARQREVLGVLGVNVIHGAFFHRASAPHLISMLMENLSRDQVELDMIKLVGPAFPDVDQRLISLQLVEQNLTRAAMFTASGEVVQPSEVLYKKPIIVERGNFRPATNLTEDLLQSALEQFRAEPEVHDQSPVVLAEMTLRSLLPGRKFEHEDFLARADILGALGFDVLISRFEPYYQMVEYLARYTDSMIGIAVGLPIIRHIIDERYYSDLQGGALEAIGRLFKRTVRMYVHPTRDPVSGQVQTMSELAIPPPWHHTLAFLLEMGRVAPIRSFNESYLSIQTRDVLARIERGDRSWEALVPPVVAEIINKERLFQSVPPGEVDAAQSDAAEDPDSLDI